MSVRVDFVHLHVHTEFSMLDGAARLGRAVRRDGRARHGRDRDDRPRQHVRGLRVLHARPRAHGDQADHRHWRPTARPAPRARAPAGPVERRRRRRRVGWRRLHPHDPAGRVHRGHAQPLPAARRAPRSRVSTTSPGWTASCSRSTPRASSPRPAARRARSRPSSGSATTTRPAQSAGRLPGHLRRRTTTSSS